MLGTRINDRYVVESRLGGGGGGEVYRARDLWADELPVALKLLSGERPSSSELRRFSNEFFTLRSIRHPHLVAFREYGRIADSGHLYYTMDLLPGGDLASLAAPDDRQLARLISQVSRGLQFLHDRGLIHGDLKPENILLSDAEPSEAVAQIADFGLVHPQASSRENEGNRGGTLAFMAPEILAGEPRGREADLYALGSALYKTLTGHAPFVGNPEQVARAILEDEVAPPSERGAAQAWDPLVGALLDKRPEGRPSWTELFSALHEIGGETALTDTPEVQAAYLIGVPFTAREDIFDRMRETREALAKEAATGQAVPRSSAIAIVGEEGIGKTRLLHEFERSVVDAGIDFIVGDCNTNREVPYAVWREVFDQLALQRTEVDNPFLESRESADDDETDSGSPVAEAVARTLEEEARRAPLVLLIENRQWLDEDSLAVLQHVLRRMQQRRREGSFPLLVLAATRSPEPDALWQEWRLDRLNAEETQRFVESLLGHVKAAPSFYAFLHEASDGNPLLLLECLRQALSQGAVSREREAWIVDESSLRRQPTGKLAQIVRLRLAELGDRQRLVGAALATLREPSPPGLVAGVAAMPTEEAAMVLAELERAGLVRSHLSPGGVRWDLSQGVFGSVWSTQFPEEVQCAMHARAAEALESRREGTAEARGYHWEQAGEPRRAFPHLLEAAATARKLRAADKVVDFSRRALEAAGSDNDASRDAMDHLAWGLAHSDRREEAVQTYRILLAAAHPSERARFACRAADLERLRGNYESARAILDELGPVEETDRAWDRVEAARILADLYSGDLNAATERARNGARSDRAGTRLMRAAGFAFLREGSLPEARETTERALAIDEASGKQLHTAACRSVLARILVREGDHDAAVSQMRKALETYRGRDELMPRARLTMNLGVLQAGRGDSEAAARSFQDAHRLLERAGDRGGMAVALNNLAQTRWRQERLSDAVRLYEKCLALRRELGAPAFEAQSLMDLACTYTRIGDLERAEGLLREAEEVLPENAPADLRAELEYTHGCLERAHGRVEPARSHLARAADLARGAGDAELEQDIQSATVRLMLAAEDPDALEAARAYRESAERGADPLKIADALVCAGRAEVSQGNRNDGFDLLREGVQAALETGLCEPVIVALQAMADLEPSPGTAMEHLSRAMEKVEQLASQLDSAHANLYLNSRRQTRLREQFLKASHAALDSWSSAGGYFPDPAIFSGPEAGRANHLLREREQQISRLETVLRHHGHKEGRLTSLMDVTRDVNALRPLDELLPTIMDRAIRLLGAERGFLMLQEREGPLEFRVARDARGQDLDRAEFLVSYSMVREVARTGRGVITSDAQDDDRFRDQRSVISLDLRSVLVVPLQVGERVLGAVCLDNRYTAGAFDEEDQELLMTFSAHAATAIENARLYEAQVEQQRMAQELQIAGRIQHQLLPGDMPSFEGFRTAARMAPAREVGGDFYDAALGEDGWGRMLVGDVSGKGVPAGLLMVMVQTVLRSLMGEGRDSQQILSQANAILESQIDDESFLTAVLLEIDPRNNTVRYTSAGHPRPLRLSMRDGSAEFLPSEGIGLGILEDCSHILSAVKVDLAPGDLMLLYSDGVTECVSPEGEMYGQDRLRHFVEQTAARSPAELVDAVFEELERFRAGAEPADDITVLVLQRDPAA